MNTPSHQHVYMVNKVQEEHSQLHDKVCVVDVCSFILPGPQMLQIPEVNGVSEKRGKQLLHVVSEQETNAKTRQSERSTLRHGGL